MPAFSVQFDLAPLESLDQLALLARQDYNLGGVGKWFNEFRGGLYGFYARLYGIQRHYYEVHAWLPHVRLPTDTEYHLASILFQMDSALVGQRYKCSSRPPHRADDELHRHPDAEFDDDSRADCFIAACVVHADSTVSATF